MDKLAELTKQYTEAEEAYKTAQIAESAARSRATDALNRLNACQKAVRAYMDEQMSKAPRESDWWREKNRRQEIGV